MLDSLASTFQERGAYMESNILIDNIEEWVNDYKQTTIKPASYLRLQTSISLLKKYLISGKYTSELTSEDVQRYLNKLVEDGYAFTTIKKQYHLITAFLKFAAAKGIISKPIYTIIEAPTKSPTSIAKEVVAYSKLQQASLKKVLSSSKYLAYDIDYFLLETGLRVGEVLALTWDDVLWERKALRINKTLLNPSSVLQSRIQDSAKTKSSNRTIPLSKKAIEILERLLSQAEFNSDELGCVFSNNLGQPYSYKALCRHTRAACKQALVPYYGMHVFRHTFATNCYYKGCDVKILSKLLGHSSASVTYNFYIHLYGDALEEMRSIVD